MTEYELLFITKPDLEDSVQKDIVAKTKGIIETGGGKIINTDVWGKRELASLIDKHTQGYYVLLKYNGTGAINQELESRFRINENMLRQLITLAIPAEKTEKKAKAKA